MEIWPLLDRGFFSAILHSSSVAARHTEPFGSGFLFLHGNTLQRGKSGPEGFFFPDSGTMRHVGGSSLNNPVTRANQSRDGGLRIEPGGRSAMAISLFSVSDGMAP